MLEGQEKEKRGNSGDFKKCLMQILIVCSV